MMTTIMTLIKARERTVSTTADDAARINAISCRLFDPPGRTGRSQFNPDGFGPNA